VLAEQLFNPQSFSDDLLVIESIELDGSEALFSETCRAWHLDLHDL
jgi:hypothetical protein